LQYGVPLKTYVKAFMSTSFAPAGITDDPEIRTASSLMDYIFRRLALQYMSFDDRLELGLASFDDMPDEDQVSLLDTVDVAEPSAVAEETTPAPVPEPVAAAAAPTPSTSELSEKPKASIKKDDTAPMCYNCGNQTQKAGSCYVCSSCGSTTGCS
jgi:ribonucleoside-diphosphate reductase alpha chain